MPSVTELSLMITVRARIRLCLCLGLALLSVAAAIHDERRSPRREYPVSSFIGKCELWPLTPAYAKAPGLAHGTSFRALGDRRFAFAVLRLILVFANRARGSGEAGVRVRARDHGHGFCSSPIRGRAFPNNRCDDGLRDTVIPRFARFRRTSGQGHATLRCSSVAGERASRCGLFYPGVPFLWTGRSVMSNTYSSFSGPLGPVCGAGVIREGAFRMAIRTQLLRGEVRQTPCPLNGTELLFALRVSRRIPVLKKP